MIDKTIKRTKFQAMHDKQRALDKAEECGALADGLAVRHALLERVRSGDITLAAAQAELKKIQRNAKKNGLATRSQVYRNG